MVLGCLPENLQGSLQNCSKSQIYFKKKLWIAFFSIFEGSPVDLDQLFVPILITSYQKSPKLVRSNISRVLIRY